MTFECKLIEKSFNKDGESHKYYALQFDLSDGSTLEITIKGDKAKLLKLSSAVENKDKSFWEK